MLGSFYGVMGSFFGMLGFSEYGDYFLEYGDHFLECWDCNMSKSWRGTSHRLAPAWGVL